MKKIIEPAKPEKAEYICDLCKKPIESDDFGTDIVKILVDSVVGNGWNDWVQREEYHSHKKCLITAIEVMRRQSKEMENDELS